MAFKFLLFAAFVAVASAGSIGLPFDLGHDLEYSAFGLDYSTFLHSRNFFGPAPTIVSKTLEPSVITPTVKILKNEDDLSEILTLIKKSPSVVATRLASFEPIIQEKTVEALPLEEKVVAPVIAKVAEPIVEKVVATPLVEEKILPVVEKVVAPVAPITPIEPIIAKVVEPLVETKIAPIVPVVEKIVAPVVKKIVEPIVTKTVAPVVKTSPFVKIITHEPSVHEYATLIKTSPSIIKTKISHPAPVIHESRTAPVVHKTVEAVPVVKKVVTPVIEKVVTPVVTPIVEKVAVPVPVVEKVATPVLEKVVAPLPVVPESLIPIDPVVARLTKLIPNEPFVYGGYSW